MDEKEPRKAKRRERGVFEKERGSGIWWVRYADGNGKIRREKVGPKGLALRLYRKRKVQVREQGFFPERTKDSGQTFADAMDSYLTRRESFWKAGPEWKRIGEKWKERFKGRRLREITRGDVQGEVSTFALDVKSGTVNRHLTLLKAFFRDAVDNGAIENNSAQFVKKLRENNERVRYLTEAEEERLFTELPEK
jgi:hypothetical protein